MKFLTIPATCLALLPALAAGELYLYEGFGGYAAGQLPGQAISSSTLGLDTATAIIGGGTAAVNVFGSEGLVFSNLQVSGGKGLYSSPTGAASYVGYRYNGAAVTGTLYTSFLTRIETAQNNPSSVGLRLNTANNSGGGSSWFYSFADTIAGTRTGIQYDNASGAVSSSQTLPVNSVHVVIGRFTRVGEALSEATPGIGTTFVLTRDQFDHFKENGFTDAELDGAAVGSGAHEVFSRVADAAVTSGTFNVLTNGRGVQFGVGNAGVNQIVSYDEIRMGSSLDDVLPVDDSPPAEVYLSVSRVLAPEPVPGNDLPGEITAMRAGSTANALEIQLATSGSASPGEDFIPITSATFPPGEDTVRIAIRPYTDDLAEADETVTLSLLPGAGYTIGGSSEATVTIVDRPFGVDASKSRFIQKLEAGISRKIVVYGTSLTAGGFWSGQMLAALQTSYPGLVTLVNSGGSGMESDWGVANLQTRVINENPDVVFIEFSVNDSVDRFNLSLARANANLLTMINGIKAALPDCEIILQVMNPVIDRPEGHSGWRPNLHLYQQGYREIGQQNRLLVIDHMAAWQAVLDEGDAVYRSFVPDGLHPEAEGYRRFVTPVILATVGVRALEPPSLVIDDADAAAVASGAWTGSAATSGYYGAGYLHDGDAGKGTKSFTFTPEIPVAGNYPVYLRWTAGTNRANNVPVTITHSGGSSTVVVNQRLNNGVWMTLGVFPFAAGSSGNIRIDTTGTNGYVIADAAGIGLPGGLPHVMLRGDKGRAAEPPSATSAGRDTGIIVSRSGSMDGDLTVFLETSGSAGNGTDHAAFPASIVIPAGASSASWTVAPLPDDLAEGEESFRVAIVPDSVGYVLATPVKASVVIEDRPFDAWRFRNFSVPQLADPLVSGDLADPDKDGLGNLLEFFTGRLPTVPDTAGVSRPGSVTLAGEFYQTLTYDKHSAAGLTGTAEISSDIMHWDSGPLLLDELILSDDGLKQVIQVRSRAPLGSAGNEFLRLKVTRDP